VSHEILQLVPSAPVRQILLNLLLNASSAAPEGGVVSLDVREEGDSLHLAVTDDGPGLSETAGARLLSQAPVEPGGGVGLRLVRDLVAGLGGGIACNRSDGRTEITVRLPVCEARPC